MEESLRERCFIDHIVITDAVPNAFATNFKNSYITALHSAFYLACLDTAFSILATKDVLTSLGRHELEDTRVIDANLGFGWKQFSSPQDYMIYLQANMPKCPTRNSISHALAALMTSFIYWHEEGHVMLGHVDYMIARKKVTRVHEQGISHHNSVKRRALAQISELEADAWAIHQILSPLSIRQLNNNYSTLDCTQRQWIFLSWLAAALTGTLLSIIYTRDVTAPTEWLSHPHDSWA